MESTKVILAVAVLSFTAPVQSADPGKVILAEVLFAPAPGETSFVELVNVGGEPVDLTSMLLQIDTLVLPLPRLAAPLAPGARVLVRFDGRGTIEERVIHADAAFALNDTAGVVRLLRNDNSVLDRVAWGTAEGAVVATIGGLAVPQVERGTSFGRPPGANRPGARGDWVFYPPGQATPGRPNPLPSVAQLLPVDGAILEGNSAELGWYPVPGAARYRVQLSKDTSFSAPLLNQVVEIPPVSTGQLAAGVYWWRVQALPADGPAAAWSSPARLELGLVLDGGGDGSGPGGSGPSAPGSIDEASGVGAARVLNVPFISQHKDSKMLHLEAQQEGTLRTSFIRPPVPHAWDRDHGILDRNDPADNQNCTLASLAMINRFYTGNLTQDRIGYEVWSRNVTNYVAAMQAPAVQPLLARLFVNLQDLTELQPGPEGDLHYNVGMPWARLAAASIFALGALPGNSSGALPPYGLLTTDDHWTTITTEINAGRPLMGHYPGHAIVIRGYQLLGSRRLVLINDPWHGRYAIDLDATAPPPMGKGLIMLWAYPNHPAIGRQEPSVTTDRDGDGVFDFDETERFHTNPNNTDSDADGVPDKQDIESGIYETNAMLGYAWNPVPNSAGRDYDHDGIPTELDRDSDNGGCTDGEEDLNKDGESSGAETNNFDQTDDVCGNLQGSVSYLIEAISASPDNPVQIIHDQGVIQVRLKPESPGSTHYVDNGSTWTYQGHARLEVDLGQCILWGWEGAHGGGTFVADAIGGARGDDGTMALGAQADVPAQSASGGCGRSGSGPSERTMSFPYCDGILVPTPAGQPQVPTYRFDCTTKPDMGAIWTVTQFYARGTVRVQ